MPNTLRTPGKFGRKPAKMPVGLHELTHYAAGALPRPPASVAVPDVGDWGMLGNDTYGDCGVAGLEHGFMATAADTGQSETPATTDQAVSYYLGYTGGEDEGVVLADYLAYVKANGYYGRSVAAYAPVKVQDIPTLQFAVDAYDFAYCGIVVTEAMQGAFANGKPWTTSLLDSPVAGGHCVPVAGYDSDYLRVITWGGVQEIAYSAWHYIASEAWAVITDPIVTKGGDGRGGISLAALQADLGKLNF